MSGDEEALPAVDSLANNSNTNRIVFRLIRRIFDVSTSQRLAFLWSLPDYFCHLILSRFSQNPHLHSLIPQLLYAAPFPESRGEEHNLNSISTV